MGAVQLFIINKTKRTISTNSKFDIIYACAKSKCYVPRQQYSAPGRAHWSPASRTTNESRAPVVCITRIRRIGLTDKSRRQRGMLLPCWAFARLATGLRSACPELVRSCGLWQAVCQDHKDTTSAVEKPYCSSGAALTPCRRVGLP